MTNEKNSHDTQEKISQLQLYEQSLQNILLQKQQFQSQIGEIDSALKELKTSTESYKIVGNIMVRAEKDTLKKDLEEKNSALKLRIETLEKQEEKIKSKAESLQAEIMQKMEDKDG